jgi:hypothetical protein
VSGLAWLYVGLAVTVFATVLLVFFQEVSASKTLKKWTAKEAGMSPEEKLHAGDMIREKGFQFTSMGPDSYLLQPQLMKDLKEFALFQQGGERSKKVDHVMKGTAGGVPWTMFDYNFKPLNRVSQDRTEAHSIVYPRVTQTVAYAVLTRFRFPPFLLLPRVFPEDVPQLLTQFQHKSIWFKSHPDFSERYNIRYNEEKDIRYFFTPTILEFLEKKNEPLFVEGNEGKFVYYMISRRIETTAMVEFSKEATEILRVFVVEHYQQYLNEQTP